MKKLLSLVAAMIIAATTFAQVDEVTLTVIGTGQTEEQATLQALRSAIEQSFGTFVSANTTILNDKLVQDEIISVSNGNVKEYKKIAVATLPNQQVSVSLKATVSVNKLVSYVKSKGSRAEFDGSSYAAHVKLIKLQAESKKKAYIQMMKQMEKIAKDLFDFSMQIGSPVRDPKHRLGDLYYIPCEVSVKSNIASTNFYNLYYKTLDELKLDDTEIIQMKQQSIELTDVTTVAPLSKPRYGKDDKLRIDISNSTSRNVEKIFIPISWEEANKYDISIRWAIFDALFRYKICEISNPKNSYEFMKIHAGDRFPLYTFGYTLTGGTALGDGDYVWHSNLWDVDIHSLRPKTLATRFFSLTSSPLKSSIITSAYTLPEVRQPIKLSKQQQKELKKGHYTGPTYTITYGDPKIVEVHHLMVAVPANRIETFKGFELKY